MKKKIIAIGLITTMVVCNSMTVWAEDTWSGDGQYNLGYTTDDPDTPGVNEGGKLQPDSADERADNNSGKKNVKGTYNLGSATPSYTVEIIWGDLTYMMDPDDEGTKTDPTSTWNSGKKWYDIENFPGWVSTDSGTADMITVNNKSNVAVKATFAGTVDVSEGSLLKGTYGITSGNLVFTGNGVALEEDGDNRVLKLPTYEGADTVPTGSSIVSVNGAIITKAPSLKNTEGITLGTVTVTIAQQ